MALARARMAVAPPFLASTSADLELLAPGRFVAAVLASRPEAAREGTAKRHRVESEPLTPSGPRTTRRRIDDDPPAPTPSSLAAPSSPTRASPHRRVLPTLPTSDVSRYVRPSTAIEPEWSACAPLETYADD